MDIIETAGMLRLQEQPSPLAQVAFFVLVPSCALVILYVLGRWLVKRFEPMLLIFLLFPFNFGLIGGVLLYAFNDGLDITLDRRADTFQRVTSNLWGHTTSLYRVPLPELEDAKVRTWLSEDSDSHTSTPLCQIVVVRQGGEEIPLFDHSTSDCEGQRRLADTLHRFLYPPEKPIVLDDGR